MFRLLDVYFFSVAVAGYLVLFRVLNKGITSAFIGNSQGSHYSKMTSHGDAGAL